MKAFKTILMMSLFAFATSGLFTGCDDGAFTSLNGSTKLNTRACNTITQTYVGEIKRLAASELEILPAAVSVGLVEKLSSESGLWYDPSEVIGMVIDDDFEGFLFVAYEDNPLTDVKVVGYWYDENFCVMPSSLNIVTDDFEGILALTIEIVVDDIEGI